MNRALSALVLFLAVAAPLAAQTPTAEQLQIFQNLSPEQQQALLQQLGGMQTNGTGATSTSNGQSSRLPDMAAELARRQAARPPLVPAVPVMAPEDTVLVTVKSDDDAGLTGTELAGAESLVELIRNRNPYVLDRSAQLNLPGFAGIPLAGLTEEQANARLAAEPALRGIVATLTRVPLVRTGAQGLQRFGYDLFDNAPSTFSPVTDVPVPADYVIGPGDQLNVQLFGSQSRSLALTVDRDGSVSFPELGPIRLGGMTFNAARSAIETRVSQQMIGVQASVSMGDTRSIRVFVLGEARVPGSYTVSGLATMTTALFASGGVKEIGSLRDIQLKRQGEVVQTLDLYDLLIRGNTSDDAKLLPGDVIFIPPVGPTVSVSGEVKRPAIYELHGDASAQDVVQMAGGLTPEADAGRSSITRIDDTSRRVALDLDLRDPAGRAMAMRNGDLLQVSRLRPQLDSGVVLGGFVYRPGAFAWRQGMKITDVIGSVEELKPDADQHYVLIRREDPLDRHISVFSADLAAAWAAPDSTANITLEARDQITVFDLGPGRDRIIEPLMEELRLQAGLDDPTPEVRALGRVKVPGSYPLEPGMRVRDLLRAGGELAVEAYGAEAELTRYTIDNTGTRQTNLIDIDLAAVRRGDAAANIVLQPFDTLLVKEAPEWRQQEAVTLRGEVRFPGTYPIRKGETLHEVLQRAGGLTDQAFATGSAFTRKDLKELEQQQLDQLRDRMKQDLATMSLQAANAGQKDAGEVLIAGQALLSQLQGATATGRFVIDLPALIAEKQGGEHDVMLRDGDELLVPKQRQEVTVIGEVQNASSHLYLSGRSLTDYIAQSGGTTRKADKRRIYVVRASGSVAIDKEIRAGDTIVVPLDTERMPRLPFWQAVTQILYNVAVSVAAVNSF